LLLVCCTEKIVKTIGVNNISAKIEAALGKNQLLWNKMRKHLCKGRWFDVLASSSVAWNIRCALNASGLERMGLEGGSFELLNRSWGRFEGTGIWPQKFEFTKSNRRERARAERLLAQWNYSCRGHLARAG
jgi:hypothetical protein